MLIDFFYTLRSANRAQFIHNVCVLRYEGSETHEILVSATIGW